MRGNDDGAVIGFPKCLAAPGAQHSSRSLLFGARQPPRLFDRSHLLLSMMGGAAPPSPPPVFDAHDTQTTTRTLLSAGSLGCFPKSLGGGGAQPPRLCLALGCDTQTTIRTLLFAGSLGCVPQRGGRDQPPTSCRVVWK